MFSLVSGPFIVMFVLATFDPDETNSLLIPKLFALLSRKSQVSLSNCPVVPKAKNGRRLTVYVLQEWLLHIGVLVLSSLC